MKRLLVLFAVIFNLLGVFILAAATFAFVHGVIDSHDTPVTVILAMLGLGSAPLAVTAAVLYQKHIVSAGRTWGEVASDFAPLLPYGRRKDDV